MFYHPPFNTSPSPNFHLKLFSPFPQDTSALWQRNNMLTTLSKLMSGHRRHAEATSSSSTFSILPSPHPSRWRNSQPSLQVARLPRPAEHVFSSPDQVRLRSSIHPQCYSGSSSPAWALTVHHSFATDDEFHSDDRYVDKGRQNMEQHPLQCL